MPATLMVLYFFFPDTGPVDDFGQQSDQIRYFEGEPEVFERPTDVSILQLEGYRSGGSETPDAKVPIDHQHRDSNIGQEIGEIGVELMRFVISILQFFVD